MNANVKNHKQRVVQVSYHGMCRNSKSTGWFKYLIMVCVENQDHLISEMFAVVINKNVHIQCV